MMNNERPAIPLSRVVGLRCRMRRELLQLTQQDIATSATHLGISWSRSSVAQLEQGTRKISAAELLALPLIFGECTSAMGRATAYPLTDFLMPGTEESLDLGGGLRLSRPEIEAMVGTSAVVRKSDRLVVPTNPVEAERKAAGQLGVDVEVFRKLCADTFDMSLVERRDAYVNKRYPGDLAPRTLQARRGQATRKVLTALRWKRGDFRGPR